MSNEGKPELRSGAREPAVRRFQALLQACEWALRGATVFIFAGCGVLGSASVAHCQTQNTCLDCHSKLITQYKVSTENLVSDVHYQKGLSCTTCHGGDASSADKERAHATAASFRGTIDREHISEFCARCHSDPAYMRGFNPSLRVDQLSQYQTSVHGKLLAKGDTRVATCVDCHGVHDILASRDPRSKTYPTNVAKTCSRCHSDADYMKAYRIKTNQYEEYSASVHYAALTDRGDLGAPTCSTCHGSHGAAPPGVDSVAMVCATCHVFQAQLFNSGPHKDAFATFNLPGCVTCHTNHRILHPTDAFIGVAPDAVCVTCHLEGDKGYQPSADMHDELTKLAAAIQRSDDLLNRADRAGMEVGEAKLALREARDDLTIARVHVHAVKPDLLAADINAGIKITDTTWVAGQAAMAERSYRRKGLLVSLGTILLALVGLFLMIRKLESNRNGDKGGRS
jgi:hypothetical protein